MEIIILGWVIFVFSAIIYGIVKQAMAPELIVSAVVVDKYIKTSTDMHTDPNTNISHTSSTDYYYIVFDVLTPEGAIDTSIGDNGRVALDVGRKQFPLILLQDSGRLTFKGSRYIGFERYQ